MPLSALLPPLLIAVAGIGGVTAFALNLRRARTIEDTPTAKIRSAAQGYVGLHGFARPLGGELLYAPLTGTPCIWYRYSIERHERGDRNSRWNTIERGNSEQLFVLGDNTGRCHVDPRRADVTTTIRQRWEGSSRHPNNHSPGGDLLAGAFGQRYRYTEDRIHADEWLYTLGWFETLHAPSPEERSAAQTRQLLNQWKQDRDALLARFDRNGDDDIDMEEWEIARTAAAREAAAAVLRGPAPAPVNTLSVSPLRDRPFLIASRDPRALANHYRHTALLSLAIGLGVAGWLLWRFY